MKGKTLTSMSGPKAVRILDDYFKSLEMPKDGTKERLRLRVALSALAKSGDAGFDLMRAVNIVCRAGVDGLPGPIQMTYRKD